MKIKTIKKWSIITLSVLTVITVASFLWIQSQIKHHTGEKTELVDTSIFKVSSTPLVIKNVSVLSTDCTNMIDSLIVIIEEGKIKQIAKNPNIPINYRIIDGSGQYLIPGLVDTHAHLHRSKNDLLLYLANGVTHISEMFGQERHLKWRKEAEEGALSPKIYVATSKIGSQKQKGVIQKIRRLFGSMHNYTDSEKAKEAVINYKEQGYDAIKLSTFLNAEIYQALVDESKRQNLPTVGHLTSSIGLKGLFVNGQSQLAHIEEITKATMYDFGGMNSSNAEEYLEYLKKNANSIAIKLKEKNIVVSSTIFIIESIYKQNFELKDFLKNIELEYQNPGEIEGSKFARGWLPGNNSYENMEIKNNPDLIEKYKIFWKTYAKAIHIMGKALVDNGVMITAGTDSNTAGVVAGFSLHDELEALKRIGMTNSQALYAATVAPAKWMQTDAGTIEIGRRADLILLNKNPLNNIKNTRSIDAVITNGRYLNRETLNKMLQEVKKANNRSRELSIDEYLD